MSEAPKAASLALIACKVFLRDRALSSAAKSVAAILLDRHNWKTGRCDPGLASIAKFSGLSRSGVRKAVDQLVEMNLVLVVKHGRGSGRNNYRFNWDLIRDADDQFQRALGYAPNGAQGMPQTGHTGMPQTGHQTLKTKPVEETPHKQQHTRAQAERPKGSAEREIDRAQRALLLPISGGKGVSYREAAHNAATRRLSVQIRDLGLEARTSPEDLEIGVRSEVERRGTGLAIVLDRLGVDAERKASA